LCGSDSFTGCELTDINAGRATTPSCRPILGTAVGALLSCGSCLTLFFLPASLMIGMSHHGGLDRIETAELTYGLTAMTLAGALAGLIAPDDRIDSNVTL